MINYILNLFHRKQDNQLLVCTSDGIYFADTEDQAEQTLLDWMMGLI